MLSSIVNDLKLIDAGVGTKQKVKVSKAMNLYKIMAEYYVG